MLNAKPKRRWLRYSLRTLLEFVTIASVGFGWLGYKVRQAKRQRATVEAIQQRGGWVLYENEVDSNGMRAPFPKASGPVWLRKIFEDDFFVAPVSLVAFSLQSRTVCTFDDAAMSHVQDLTQLKYLDLESTRVTDAGLVHLQKLGRLERLVIQNPRRGDKHQELTNAGMTHLQGLSRLKFLELIRVRVTDEGLAHLRGLSQLEELEVHGEKITDAGLVHLQGLSKLARLHLSHTAIAGPGLVHLRGLVQLRELDLSDTRLTDAAVPHLQKLTQLKIVYLDGSEISDDGRELLQKALPGLQIAHN